MIVGLTGCVGSGKSTVARALGWAVIDVDREAAIAAREAGLDPSDALRRVVQGDAALLAALVPRVEERIVRAISAAPRPCVLESALLFEQGLDALCDVTVCLTAPVEVRRARVAARTTASAGLFDQIEAAQWPEERKAAAARLVLDASRSLDVVVAELSREVMKSS